MNTILLRSSACAIIEFSVASFWFSSCITYSCFFCRRFWWLVEPKICFNLFVARMRYVFCTFPSRSFMARSVFARRLARYIVVGFSMLNVGRT